MTAKHVYIDPNTIVCFYEADAQRDRNNHARRLAMEAAREYDWPIDPTAGRGASMGDYELMRHRGD